MKATYLYIIGIAVILISLVPIYYSYQSVGKQSLEVTYQIGDKVGFDLNSTSLNFGRLIEGSRMTRQIRLENTYDFPIRIKLHPSDNLEDIIFYENPGDRILPGESINISITLIPEAGAPIGNYSGFIIVDIKR